VAVYMLYVLRSLSSLSASRTIAVRNVRASLHSKSFSPSWNIHFSAMYLDEKIVTRFLI